jgi:DNA-binding GntR family transcriptional regulator
MDVLRAYEQLESAILTGELKPRERLVEKDLAERLGVSRTPVREALRRLEERGLVRILPHRGAVVADFSPGDVENIYAVRTYLEVLASRLACERIRPEDVEHVREMEAAYATQAASGDFRALMSADDRFHDAIYVAAGNSCLLELIQQLRRQVHAVRFNAWAQPERITRSLAEHRQMVQAFERRDGARLADLTREHLGVAKDTYLAHLGTRPGPSARNDQWPTTNGAGVVGDPGTRQRGGMREGTDTAGAIATKE